MQQAEQAAQGPVVADASAAGGAAEMLRGIGQMAQQDAVDAALPGGFISPGRLGRQATIRDVGRLGRQATIRDVGQMAQAQPPGDPTASQAQAQPPGPPGDLDRLAALADAGDPGAARLLAGRAARGDQGAADVLRELGRLQSMGVLSSQLRGGGGGRGGPRVRETTTAQRRELTPEQEATLGQLGDQAAAGQERALGGLERGMRAQAQGAEDMARQILDADAQLLELRARQAEAEQARQARMERRTRELDDLARSVRTREIDSSRLFGRRNTSARIAAGIGMALAGLGDAIRGGSGGVESVLAIIDRAIDRDIDEQRANLANASRGVEQQRGILADLRRSFGDERGAEAAARSAMIQSTMRQLEALRTQVQSNVQRERIDQMLGQLQQQDAAARQQAILSGAPLTETVVERRSGGGGGGARRPQIDFGAALPESDDISREERAQLAQGISEAEAGLREIDETIAAVQAASEAIGPRTEQRLARYASDPASVLPSVLGTNTNDAAARISNAVSALGRLASAQVRELAGPGAVTDAERETFGALTQMSPETPLPQVMATLRRARRAAQERIVAARRGASTAAVREDEERAPELRSDEALARGETSDALSAAIARGRQ
jgi:hypothetical protein